MRDDELMLPLGTYCSTDDIAEAQEFDRYMIEGFSSFMLQADEPSLLHMASDPQAHVYRFFGTRSRFLSGPVLIRLTLQLDGTAVALIKIWKQVPIPDSTKHYPEYHTVIALKTQKTISKRQVNEFLHQVNEAAFWQMPRWEVWLGRDGETWDLEGVRAGQFHFVTRWMPKDKAYIEIGLTLLRLCNLRKWHRIISYINRQSASDWLTQGIELIARLVIWLGYRPKKK